MKKALSLLVAVILLIGMSAISLSESGNDKAVLALKDAVAEIVSENMYDVLFESEFFVAGSPEEMISVFINLKYPRVTMIRLPSAIDIMSAVWTYLSAVSAEYTSDPLDVNYVYDGEVVYIASDALLIDVAAKEGYAIPNIK